MSVAVAYQASTSGRLTLQEAAKEASLRQTALSVLHIPESVDIDIIEDQRTRLHDEITQVLADVNQHGVQWTLELATGVDVAETVLDLIADTDVEVLVIGARRRSALGKMIMGSVTQTIILRADVPVLVVKPPART
jgi:nucleotide-binding universal stress UspA family protein